MLITNERQRLIECVQYLASHITDLQTPKLFRLLYLLDFIHCRETGFSVTELEYFAEQDGPEPRAIAREICLPAEDWAGKVAFVDAVDQHGRRITVVKCLETFVPHHTSRRHRSILKDLCQRYHATATKDISEDVEFEHPPWHRVYVVEGKCGGLIPYEYAFRAKDADMLKDIRDEHLEFVRILRSW